MTNNNNLGADTAANDQMIGDSPTTTTTNNVKSKETKPLNNMATNPVNDNKACKAKTAITLVHDEYAVPLENDSTTIPPF